MNLLVERLRGLIPRGLPWDYGTVALEQLFGPLDASQAESAGRALRDAAEHARFGELFSRSYLVVLPGADVTRARRAARPRRSSVGLSVGFEEWVSVVEDPQRQMAVTLPDEASSAKRLSLFVDFDGSVGRVSAELDDRGELVAVSASAGRHCGFADRLKCEGGTCGTCQLALREFGGRRGYRCVCRHQP